MGLGGMLDQGRQVPSPVGDTGMAQAADGEALARARSEDRIRANAALFDDFVKKYGEIEHALKGGGMYQYQNNGAAFNPFDGTVTVADPDVRSLYQQKAQADITKSRAQAAKAARSGSGGGSSNAGWQIKQTEDGETVRVNARTGKHVPLGIKLKFGKGNDEWGSGGGASDSAEMKEYREVRARAEKRGDTATVRALDETARAMGLI